MILLSPSTSIKSDSLSLFFFFYYSYLYVAVFLWQQVRLINWKTSCPGSNLSQWFSVILRIIMMGYKTLPDLTFDCFFKLIFPSPLNLLYSSHIAYLHGTQQTHIYLRAFAISVLFTWRLFLQILTWLTLYSKHHRYSLISGSLLLPGTQRITWMTDQWHVNRRDTLLLSYGFSCI